MSNEEIKKYNEILSKITNLKTTQEKVEKNLQSIADLKSQKNFSAFLETQELLNSLDSEIKNSLQESLRITLEEAEIKWNKTIALEEGKLEYKEIKLLIVTHLET